MPVYVDVLLAVNGFTDFLLLESAKKILRTDCGKYRLFLSAAAGALFSLKIFLPDMVFALDMALRFLMCAAMSLIAFGFGSVRGFIKKLTTFFAVNLLYGGLMGAVFSLADPRGMIYRNGTVYFDIDFKILAAVSVVSYIIINLILKLTERRSPPKSVFSVEISFNGRSAKGRGLADTGNSLRELFSDTPVIVGTRGALKLIMPKDIAGYLETGNPDLLDETIRLIPSSTVAGSALLPAFRADEVIICRPSETHTHKNIYVAVSDTVFFGGEFEFLLNTELTEDAEYEKHHTENKAVYKQINRL